MTAFYTFPESLQGPLLFGVRILVSVAMMLCLLLGIVSVIKRRIAQHRAWMIRAYALGLGAGTQGFVMLPWVVTVGEPNGLLRDVLMTLAWVINLVVAEWIIRKRPVPETKAVLSGSTANTVSRQF